MLARSERRFRAHTALIVISNQVRVSNGMNYMNVHDMYVCRSRSMYVQRMKKNTCNRIFKKGILVNIGECTLK